MILNIIRHNISEARINKETFNAYNQIMKISEMWKLNDFFSILSILNIKHI